MTTGKSIEATRIQAIEENGATDWLAHAENCVEQLQDGSLTQEVREHLANEATSALMVVRELAWIWPEGTPETFKAAGIDAEMKNEVRLIDKLRRELNS